MTVTLDGACLCGYDTDNHFHYGARVVVQKHQVSLGEAEETPLRRRLPLRSRVMLPIAKVRFRERFARYKVCLFTVGGG